MASRSGPPPTYRRSARFLQASARRGRRRSSRRRTTRPRSLPRSPASVPSWTCTCSRTRQSRRWRETSSRRNIRRDLLRRRGARWRFTWRSSTASTTATRRPYFDNLKKYASAPIGTFHALPIARGKSIFKSNWIRDMGEFYGVNLFLAESSATTGGLDSLLEPTGNIKVAQDKAARAFGGDAGVLRHQRHLDLEQDRRAGAAPARRHRPDRPQLPQVAPLRARAGGRAAATTSRRSRCTQYSMYGGVPLAHDQEGAARAQGRGQARPRAHAGADQLHVRRPHLQRRSA